MMRDSTMLSDDANGTLRRGLYWLLAALALAQTTAGVMRVASDKGDTPFLSANDRSRWAMIRAVGDQNTFALDQVSFRPDGRRNSPWHSIDMVRRQGNDGLWRYYSSKPPLFPLAVAGLYRLVKFATGTDLEKQPFYVGRILLVLVNILPLALYLALAARLAERLATGDWPRLFLMAVACFGGFVTTFSVTLNNHTPAAVTAMATLYLVLEILLGGRSGRQWFFLAGLAAGLTAANELPALALAAVLGLGLTWRWPFRAWTAYWPAVLLVVAVYVGTNYLAHQSLRPPYMHRGDGPVAAVLPPGQDLQIDSGPVSAPLLHALEGRLNLSAETTVRAAEQAAGWVLHDPVSRRQWALRPIASAAGPGWEVRYWDNWYDYPGTYWTDARRQGVDRGEPSRTTYALHALIGHHGWFSLTPVMLLAPWGVWCWLTSRDGNSRMRWLILGLAGVSILVFGFYLSRDQVDRNYGGVTAAFRWAIWLTPLWWLAMIPACERLGRTRWGRGIGVALLACSAFSVWLPLDNPWSHPWIYRYWQELRWLSP